jgi:hypothetical protein
MEVAQTLRDAYNRCNPVQPLPPGDPRYVDCTPVRGNEDVVSQMFNTIVWSERHVAQLFTGHRGSGKSTELLRLQARLEEAGYVVLYFEADDDLDLNDLGYTDLLLSIARRVSGDLKTKGIDLPDALLKNVADWFGETLYSEEERREIGRELAAEASLGIGLPASMPFLARLLARLTGQIKTGRAIKTEIRRALDPQISQLIGNVNLLLYAADILIRRQGKQGLVLLIDNLDRIVLRDLGDGRTTHHALYLERGDQMRALRCNIIFTVPISVIYSDKATAVTAIFPDYQVLPMIKISHEDGSDYSTGVGYLRDILGSRMDLDLLCSRHAVRHLCRVSGGHPRDLLVLVRYACTYAPRDEWPRPITLDVVRRAEARLVAEYNRMIPERHFPLLARVHLRKTVQNDEDHELMLYNLSVLEYINDASPWHDVHPAVTGLPRFQEALRLEKAKAGIGSSG